MICKTCRKKKKDIKCSCGKILVYGGTRYFENNNDVICRHCNKRHDKVFIDMLIRANKDKV